VATRGPGRRRARGRIQSFRRYCRYRLVIPVFRSADAAEYTARGVANGVFWGLTPSVGLQTIAIGLTWWIGRKAFKRDSSLLQGLIWVWVNNPLTMVPLYYAFYVTGLWLMGDAGLASGYDTFVALLDGDGERGWVERTGTLARTVGAPMAIGCLPYALVGAGVSYRWAERVIGARRRRITAARGRRIERIESESPEPGPY
jgi:uncharacterized protein (DUF2062 family)